MRIKKKSRVLVVVGLLSVVLGLSACEGEPSVMEPAVEDDSVLAAMDATIQDEFRAELIYQKVLDDFGSVRPFVNIINAEVRHSEAIARLYVARGLPVPESRWALNEIPAFPSITDACEAGVQAEIENVGIYDRYFDRSLPADVRVVFENNRAASLDKHLPAFQRCS